MKDAMKAGENIKTVHFKQKYTTELPRAPMTEGKVEERKFVIETEGDYDLITNDFLIKTNLFGNVISLLQKGDKQYWQIAGNWYEAPTKIEMAPPISEALSTSQYLKYYKELKKLGDTKVDGVDCYRVVGTPDMKEWIKAPGLSQLLKDPSGLQVRTVDELEKIKGTFEFFIEKADKYIKRQVAKLESPAPKDLIRLNYAEPGDFVKDELDITYSDFNKKLDIEAPKRILPWEGPTPEEQVPGGETQPQTGEQPVSEAQPAPEAQPEP